MLEQLKLLALAGYPLVSVDTRDEEQLTAIARKRPRP